MKIEHTPTAPNMDFTPGKPIRTYNEQGKWRDWSTDELVGQRLNVTKNWQCGAGVDSLYIDMDGNVWTASCRVGGKLGNIWAGFKAPDSWITCTKSLCTCGADLFIPKVNEEAKLSDVAKTVTVNYSTYYDCAVIHDAMIEWYQIQKKIYESVK